MEYRGTYHSNYGTADRSKGNLDWHSKSLWNADSANTPSSLHQLIMSLNPQQSQYDANTLSDWERQVNRSPHATESDLYRRRLLRCESEKKELQRQVVRLDNECQSLRTQRLSPSPSVPPPSEFDRDRIAAEQTALLWERMQKQGRKRKPFSPTFNKEKEIDGKWQEHTIGMPPVVKGPVPEVSDSINAGNVAMDSLRRQVDTLQKSHNELLAELKTTKEALSHLQEAEMRAQALEKQLENAKSQLMEAEQRCESEKSKLAAENNNLQSNISLLENQVASANQHARMSMNREESFKEQIQHLEREINELHKEKEMQERDKRQEKARAEQEVLRLQQLLRESNKQLEEVAEKAQRNQELLNEELNNLRKGADQLQQSLANCQSHCRDNERLLDEATRAKDRAENEITNYRKEIQRLQQQMESDRHAASSAAAAVANDLSKQIRLNEELQNQLHLTAKAVNDGNQELCILKKEYNNMQQSMQQKIQSLLQAKTIAENEANEAKNKAEQMYSKWEVERTALITAKLQAERLNEQLQNDINSLQMSLVSMNDKLQQGKSDIMSATQKSRIPTENQQQKRNIRARNRLGAFDIVHSQ